MVDEFYQPLGHPGGTAIGVRPTLNRQDILIEHSDLGQRLACLLAFGKADIVRHDQRTFWRIAHNRQVDDLLVELIDLLITIRYAHPATVQLDMILPPDEPRNPHCRHPTSTPQWPSPALASRMP